jgi:enamine deaminase RidA (YjgF/YER057c/UK114 family)
LTELPSAALARNGITLPEPAVPSFNYSPVTLHEGVMYVSGQVPKENGEVRITGHVGGEVSLEDARRAARICALQGLACAAAAVGGVDNIKRVLKVTAFVASAPGFVEQPRVAEAVSDLLVLIFGEAGRHARSAVGVAELPRNSPVEVEFVFTYHV